MDLFFVCVLGIPERFGERRTRQRKRTVRAHGLSVLKGSWRSCSRQCSLLQQMILLNLGAYLTLTWNWIWDLRLLYSPMQILWINFMKEEIFNTFNTIFSPACLKKQTHPRTTLTKKATNRSRLRLVWSPMILHRTWFLSRSGLDDFIFGSFALWFCFALMFAFSLQDAREQRQQVLASLAGKVVEILDDAPGPCQLGWKRKRGHTVNSYFLKRPSQKMLSERSRLLGQKHLFHVW